MNVLSRHSWEQETLLLIFFHSDFLHVREILHTWPEWIRPHQIDSCSGNGTIQMYEEPVRQAIPKSISGRRIRNNTNSKSATTFIQGKWGMNGINFRIVYNFWNMFSWTLNFANIHSCKQQSVKLVKITSVSTNFFCGAKFLDNLLMVNIKFTIIKRPFSYIQNWR